MCVCVITKYSKRKIPDTGRSTRAKLEAPVMLGPCMSPPAPVLTFPRANVCAFKLSLSPYFKAKALFCDTYPRQIPFHPTARMWSN